MSGEDTVSRRTFATRWLQGLGLLAAWKSITPARAEQVAGSESSPLTMRVMRPYNAETPVQEFTSFLTPAHRLFVRSHFGSPPSEMMTEPQWKLHVGGAVERSQFFSLKTLRGFEPVTMTAVLQCSGNGRAFHRPKVPGVQWERGAVGNAQWTGVRLRDVLAVVGVRDGAKHVQFQGADQPVATAVPLFIRSIPLEKALHPDTLLAYEMNGRPLPLLHGAPLRVITPGWMAESCIKWLTDIVVREDESKGYYMQTAYRIPAMPVAPGALPNAQVMLPVETMVVKSLIVSPSDGARVGQGPTTVQGVAWSGEAKVVKVEVSIDDGKTWGAARLVGEDHPYAWRQWQFVWKPNTNGTMRILCRATDVGGATQPETSPWNPSGFLWNGWDRVTITVAA